jgi:APA family basic amino acid/polyamine antiporter
MPQTTKSDAPNRRSLFLRKTTFDPTEGGGHGPGLKRTLGALDLTLLGIGAIIGAGLFSSIKDMITGTAVLQGAGPSVVISFGLTALACGFAAMCYAEISAMVPVSGSAYSYSYAAFGEIVAWIIGWDLMIEYAIGNVYVAQSWADYFQTFLAGISHDRLQLPLWLMKDFQSATQMVADASKTLADAAATPAAHAAAQSTLDAWAHVPRLFGWVVSCNLPATTITIGLTILLFVGVKESARANAAMVVLKVALILAFLAIGVFHVDPANWHPFAPNGFHGIWQAAALGFFAYIGFDAVSTAAEETRNPQRDMPRGLIWSLVICTVLYMATAAVLTGVVPYASIVSQDPLAEAFKAMGLQGGATAFALGAVVAMTAVLLVFQLGQTRIFMVMARDGLLPKVFSKVHPKHQTPHVNTWVTGLLVAISCNVMTPGQAIGLCNIGTLFAFVLVSIGVIVLRQREPDRPRPFKVPGYPVTPILSALACLALICGLEVSNWLRLAIWLQMGLVVYASFGFQNSVQRRKLTGGAAAVAAAPLERAVGWLLVVASFALSYFLVTGIDADSGAHQLAAGRDLWLKIVITVFLGVRLLFVEILGLGLTLRLLWVHRVNLFATPAVIAASVWLEPPGSHAPMRWVWHGCAVGGWIVLFLLTSALRRADERLPAA